MNYRIAIIRSNNPFFETSFLQFNSKETKDSEALHQLLCEVDPGEEYTVEFKTLEATTEMQMQQVMNSTTSIETVTVPAIEKSAEQLTREITEEHGMLQREIMHETVDEYYF